MIDIRDVLFWILMSIAVALIIWRVFGQSPDDFYILLTILISLTLKLWSVSDKLERHLGEDRHFKLGFATLAKDFKAHINKK